ncbi:Ribonuclease H-like superfamily [Sesbania bispinosa]|nr:Ribonuclease H-like superfamily [Sesbania bispinosa]
MLSLGKFYVCKQTSLTAKCLIVNLISALFGGFPPPRDFSNLNVDGSFTITSSKMGIGGVLWDSQGDWIWGLSGSNGQGISLLAELLALKPGLDIAWDKGIGICWWILIPLKFFTWNVGMFKFIMFCGFVEANMLIDRLAKM